MEMNSPADMPSLRFVLVLELLHGITYALMWTGTYQQSVVVHGFTRLASPFFCRIYSWCQVHDRHRSGRMDHCIAKYFRRYLLLCRIRCVPVRLSVACAVRKCAGARCPQGWVRYWADGLWNVMVCVLPLATCGECPHRPCHTDPLPSRFLLGARFLYRGAAVAVLALFSVHAAVLVASRLSAGRPRNLPEPET